MTKETPCSGSVMAAFRTKALGKGKGKGSLKTIVADNLSLSGHLAPQLLLMGERREREGSRPILPRPLSFLAAP